MGSLLNKNLFPRVLQDESLRLRLQHSWGEPFPGFIDSTSSLCAHKVGKRELGNSLELLVLYKGTNSIHEDPILMT